MGKAVSVVFEATNIRGEAVPLVFEAVIVPAEAVLMCLRLLFFRARLFL